MLDLNIGNLVTFLSHFLFVWIEANIIFSIEFGLGY